MGINLAYSALELHRKHCRWLIASHRQISNISRTLVGNNIVDHSDVVGASPAGAAPTIASFSKTIRKDTVKARRQTFKFWGFGAAYIRDLTVYLHKSNKQVGIMCHTSLTPLHVQPPVQDRVTV